MNILSELPSNLKTHKMSEKIYTERVQRIMRRAIGICEERRNEFLTPEHLLYALMFDDSFNESLDCFYPAMEIEHRLSDYISELEKVPGNMEIEISLSVQMGRLLNDALAQIRFSNAPLIDIPHLAKAILNLKDSWGGDMLRQILGNNVGDFISMLIENPDGEELIGEQAIPEHPDPEESDVFETDAPREQKTPKKKGWKSLVTCMNDIYSSRNPLIGRERELRRTVQVLCRKDKNNPLHIGEPGVGKTALVWGLVRMIEEGNVPERLKGSRVYLLDLGTLLAGTQFRGDFEKRLKEVMEGIREEGAGNIVYIDEIHTLVGAGATGEGAMDASNILKPYLEEGAIRFIGATTYEEFNRHFSKSKGLVRRFQKIDIEEPTIEEAKDIIRQLQPHYESFHGVRYSPEGIDFAVEASARHISDRFLPDKALDLVDEAGAAMEMQEVKGDIGVREVADVLSKITNVDALAQADKEDYSRLENLSQRMSDVIYGQDQAIRQVVESVQMARAGLLDENKPLASLLFVGPTGVGKTEVAKVLSHELGVELVRFDMSEYVEKHSVAKFIGSPAGYVGYDDGGLLTDAVRKSPNCVLLLDEIEKAHEDIYNILLQVMDYGRLTDNKGRHADFRNVILVMTSNAGARHASRANLGFASTATRGGAMMTQVKRLFKPEFLNRLSGTVVFNDMDRGMATLILQKKLRELQRKLDAKKIVMELSAEAFEWILSKGFTQEYGAREMDRVIRQHLSPLLMREILFGSLREGGKASVTLSDDNLTLS